MQNICTTALKKAFVIMISSLHVCLPVAFPTLYCNMWMKQPLKHKWMKPNNNKHYSCMMHRHSRFHRQLPFWQLSVRYDVRFSETKATENAIRNYRWTKKTRVTYLLECMFPSKVQVVQLNLSISHYSTRISGTTHCLYAMNVIY